MQNAGIAALALEWRYLAFDTHPNDLRQAIDGAKAMKFIGLNLTVPHKLLAMEMVDEFDDSAKTWGAVNTIRFEACAKEGEWRPLGELPAGEVMGVRSRGFNTDADALARSLREDLECNLRGSTVLLLGAGGAGRAAALKLAAENVEKLYLMNRTRAKAEAVGEEINQRFPKVDVRIGYPSEGIDLMINSTSLGLRSDDPLPLDQSQFPLRKARGVFDMIYRPAETPLLQLAKAAGCRVANGLSMLLYQGTKALQIWSGRAAPEEVMRKALEQNVYGRPQHE